MTYGHYPLTGIGGRYVLQKVSGTLQQDLFTFYVVRPYLAFQIGNITSSKTSPVAFAKQFSSPYR